jgi:purine nucleoside permease
MQPQESAEVHQLRAKGSCSQNMKRVARMFGRKADIISVQLTWMTKDHPQLQKHQKAVTQLLTQYGYCNIQLSVRTGIATASFALTILFRISG